MMKKLLNMNLCFTIVLTILVNTIVYFSFANVYSSTILNFESFNTQFENGIYQYRILSAQLLINIYEILGSLNIDYKIFKLHFINPESEPQMYLSFYILNTFFAVLSSILLHLVLHSKWVTSTPTESLLITNFCVLMMALSQYVIVPYDFSSYFFLLLFMIVFLQYLENAKTNTLLISCLIIILSTLNRESSALALALASTLLYDKYGLKKETILPMVGLTIAFLLTYIALRFNTNEVITNDGNLSIENFTVSKNWLGFLFSIYLFIFSLLLSKDKKKQARNILIFHILSLPYIIMCFYSGILYEVRLYIPLFLISLILSRLEIKKINSNI